MCVQEILAAHKADADLPKSAAKITTNVLRISVLLIKDVFISKKNVKITMYVLLILAAKKKVVNSFQFAVKITTLVLMTHVILTSDVST
jgi:hypothetical protein